MKDLIMYVSNFKKDMELTDYQFQQYTVTENIPIGRILNPRARLDTLDLARLARYTGFDRNFTSGIPVLDEIMNLILSYRIDDAAIKLLFNIDKKDFNFKIGRTIPCDMIEQYETAYYSALEICEIISPTPLWNVDVNPPIKEFREARLHSISPDIIANKLVGINNTLASERKQFESDKDLLSMVITTQGTQRDFYRAAYSNSKSCNNEFLESPTIEEWYDGEFKTIIMEALNQYMANNETRDRRCEVIENLLQVNNFQAGNAKQSRSEITDDLKVFVKSKSNSIKKLGKLPVTFISKNEHTKIRVNNDSRYQFSFAATPSDFRAIENVAHIIVNKCL